VRFSTKTEYGLKVLIELALLEPGQSLPAGEIAVREGIPQRFLEQQVTALRKAGLVASRRGAGGGSSLARPAEEITVAEAVEALEGSLVQVPEATDRSASTQVIRGVWREVAGEVGRVLSETTIAALAERKKRLDEAREPMFYI